MNLSICFRNILLFIDSLFLKIFDFIADVVINRLHLDSPLSRFSGDHSNHLYPRELIQRVKDQRMHTDQTSKIKEHHTSDTQIVLVQQVRTLFITITRGVLLQLKLAASVSETVSKINEKVNRDSRRDDCPMIIRRLVEPMVKYLLDVVVEEKDISSSNCEDDKIKIGVNFRSWISKLIHFISELFKLDKPKFDPPLLIGTGSIKFISMYIISYS